TRLRRQAKTTAAPTAWRPGCSIGVDRRDPAFQQHCCLGCGLLTVKLSGRPEVPRARQSAITLSAHEAPTHPTVHGPLQRLLEVRPHRLPLCACGAESDRRLTRPRDF